MRQLIIFALLFLSALPAAASAETDNLRARFEQRMADRRAAHLDDILDEEGVADGTADIPAGVRVLRDVAYGPATRNVFDVYLPPKGTAPLSGAPVIFMVHGGGWAFGDKGNKGVIENKVARWVPRGVIFISVNYRMVPEANPLQQAQDVAAALSLAQKMASDWGGDPEKFVLMGHSAGAHLVMLLTADPALATAAGARPWRGTVSLDSGAIDVPQLMKMRHFKLYDRAFGTDENLWTAASPYHRMTSGMPPSLLVCSTRRADSCPVSRKFLRRAEELGVSAAILPEPLSHGEINGQLGADNDYTLRVEGFLRDLGVF